MATRVLVASFSAVGGPSKLHKASDGFWAGPTDAGTYRISHCGRHSSPSYKAWSTVKWGSDIKEERGEIKVMHNGHWQSLRLVAPGVTRDMLIDQNKAKYNLSDLPKKWLFNDFGHMTCYFYKDTNNNGRLDRGLGEEIHKEYFHPTPIGEAYEAAINDFKARGEQAKVDDFTDRYGRHWNGDGNTSHGCIHLKPSDIDTMITAGYLKSGNLVRVHKYSAKPPAFLAGLGTKPYEVHFYPGERKVLILGRSPAMR